MTAVRAIADVLIDSRRGNALSGLWCQGVLLMFGLVGLVPVRGGWLLACGRSGPDDLEDVGGDLLDCGCGAGLGRVGAGSEGGYPAVDASVQHAGSAGRVGVVGHVGIDAALFLADQALRLAEGDTGMALPRPRVGTRHLALTRTHRTADR
jgi:hypothetical protein